MKKLLLIISGISLSVVINAQLVINEFMAANSTTVQDEFSEFDDWIEIYNTSDQTISLNDYYITDNYSNLTKFELPESMTIEANGFLLLFADEEGNQGDLHLNFKLSKEGESIALVKIVGNDTIVTDSFSFDAQTTDVSYGRYPDGNTFFEMFSTPTPGTSNISEDILGIADSPEFSIDGGFYSGAQSIVITSGMAGAQIRYTIDGSEPDETSSLYSSAITSDTTIVLKAKVFADDYLPSKTFGATYFIDEHFVPFDVSERLPVVSISCDNELLWSASNGLLHENNISNTWEYQAYVEFFEPDGSTAISQSAGIKLFGHSTRRMEQKSLAVIARNQYGLNEFSYKLFHDKPLLSYKSFVLRNGGNDWSETYFKDAFCQQLVRNEMDIDVQGNVQTILYLNGEFYGICNIKEKVNEHYLEDNHNADPDNIDMLSDDETIVYGTAGKYHELEGLLLKNDITDPLIYDEAERIIDIKEYINMKLAQIYIANIDMALNSKYWKEKVNYSKWRWIMYDTEMSYGQGDYEYTDTYGTKPSSNTLAFASISYGGTGWPYLRSWSSEKFIALLNNEDFRNNFIQTFAVHINTTFKPQRVLAIIDSMSGNIRNEIPYQIEKYGGHTVGFNPYGTHFTSFSDWEDFVEVMRYFTRNRPDYMRQFIEERFELNGTYELVATMDDPIQGKIYIQNIEVPVDSVGIYFDAVPLNISVEAKEGYKFLKWTGIENIDSLSPDIVVNLSENAVIEAIFEPEEDLMITEINYIPGSGDEYEFIEIYNPKHATTIDLSNYTLSGDITYTFPASTSIAPNEYIIVASNSTNYTYADIRVFEWTSGNLNDVSGVIVIKDDESNTIDSVPYSNADPWPVVTANHSVELISPDFDNVMGENWRNSLATGGSAGIPTMNENYNMLKINEFLANNDNYNADEYNECNDWIEIFNSGDESIDIGGMFITNNISNPPLYQIPANSPDQTTIQPGEYKLLWADDDTEQGPLHLGFKLDAQSGDIGLSIDGKTCFESIEYTLQEEDDSYGRYPNGENTWESFKKPTPGKYNSFPPEFTSEPILLAEKGEIYTYNVTAFDEEGDDLFFGVYQRPTWLNLDVESNESATLTGTAPSSNFGATTIKLFVTDGHTRPVMQEFQLARVLEVVDESFALEKLITYPNPTTGIINIQATTTSSFVDIIVTDITGHAVYNNTLPGSDKHVSTQIDLSGFGKGFYFISFKTESGTLTHKILVH